jgi:hypothetical protein
MVLLELLVGQVQSEGVSLYSMYIEDEEEISVDMRAGSWEPHCSRELVFLAKACLERYKKRIHPMTAVLRAFKDIQEKYCQLTQSDHICIHTYAYSLT